MSDFPFGGFHWLNKMTENTQLLERFVRDRSETAFRELVTRHINLVYSTALRVAAGDAHLAQDVTQSVFIDLARKAGTLPRDLILPGWLHRHAWFTAANAVRTERRRRNREQIAMELHANQETPDARWDQIAAQLDDSLDELSPDDRHAIVLRFLDRQDFRAIGGALSISDDAAQKRVSRALDKLRDVLGRRGVVLPAAALASVLAAEAVTAAPVGLAGTVSIASISALTTAGAGAGLATAKTIVMTKLQLAVAGTLLVAGISVPLATQHEANSRLRTENQQLRILSDSRGQFALQQLDQINALKDDNARLSNRVARAKELMVANEAAAMEALQLRGEVTHLQGLTNALRPAAPTGPTNLLSAMMNNPEMKSVLNQTYDLMIEQQYGVLLDQLGLPAGRADDFRKIQKDLLLAAGKHSDDLLSGDAAKIQDATQATLAEQADAEAKIRQLLGEDGFAQYKEYQKTLSQRMILGSFKMMLGNGANELTSPQETQLFQALVEEQSTAKLAASATVRNSSPAGATAAGLDALSQANQRVLDRSTNFLSALQVEALQKFLAMTMNQGRALLNQNGGN